ncbi:MAG: hypothetical protein ACR2NB_10905 [Solirubrobacteraceae bacterium]
MDRTANTREPALDGAVPLALLLAIPWLAPMVGVPLRGVAYGVGMLFLGLGAALAGRAALRPDEPRWAWRLYALAGLLAAAALGGALVVELGGQEVDTALRVARASVGVVALGLALHVRADARPGGRLLAYGALVLVAAASAGRPALAASLYAVAGWMLAGAAVMEPPAVTRPRPRPPRRARPAGRGRAA